MTNPLTSKARGLVSIRNGVRIWLGIKQSSPIHSHVWNSRTDFAPGKRPEGRRKTIDRRMIERLRHRGPEAVAIKSFNQEQCWLARKARVTDERR